MDEEDFAKLVRSGIAPTAYLWFTDEDGRVLHSKGHPIWLKFEIIPEPRFVNQNPIAVKVERSSKGSISPALGEDADTSIVMSLNSLKFQVDEDSVLYIEPYGMSLNAFHELWRR